MLAGLLNDGVERGVVMPGIVMKENELFDACGRGDTCCLQPGAVAPAYARGVLLRGVLGIVDQNIGARGCVEEPLIGGRVSMFMIGCVDDDSAVAADAVTGGAAGMMQGEGSDVQIAESDSPVLDLAEFSG